MKKNITGPVAQHQLSLFDDFAWQLDATTNNVSYDSNINNRWDGSNDGQQQRSRLHDGLGELQGKATVRDAEGTTARTFQPHEKTTDIGQLPEQHQLALLPDDEIADGTGHDNTRSGRNGLAGPDGTGRAINYHNTEPFYDFISFGKERHFRDNIAALQLLLTLSTEERPASAEEQSVLARHAGWGGLKEILLDPTVAGN
jgi:hypothetical protein